MLLWGLFVGGGVVIVSLAVAFVAVAGGGVVVADRFTLNVA